MGIIEKFSNDRTSGVILTINQHSLFTHAIPPLIPYSFSFLIVECVGGVGSVVDRCGVVVHASAIAMLR
jgi:hypothetical protein